jgi:sugar lactone lactonase YvrE
MSRRRIEPRRWRPPVAVRSERTGELVVRRRLAVGAGPEDVRFDDAGRIVTGTAGGRIVRVDVRTGECSVLAETGGRPLGLHLTAYGILVCDHDRGLLRVGPDGAVEVLVETTFASNVVQAADGTIWFTTSSSRWDLDHYEGDIFEHSATGRLLRRDPDGTVTTVRSGLKFANGLVLAGDDLLFAETAGYRISRCRPDGTVTPFVDNLPGFPDNLSLGSDGLLWAGIAAPRNALLDRLLPWPGLLRTAVWNLPPALRPRAARIAWVMAFDLDGRLVHDLRNTDGSYGFVTSAAERDGTLILGSLTEDALGVVTL